MLLFSSSWFRWHESAEGDKFTPLNPKCRLRCLTYNTAARMAVATPIIMKHTKATSSLLLCCSPETKAVSTLTSTIEANANSEVCFLEIASPTTRIPSSTHWVPCCNRLKVVVQDWRVWWLINRSYQSHFNGVVIVGLQIAK